MADTIIKATSGGSLKIQQESGVDALTVDTSGNIQLAGTMTAGTIGSAVAVDNCIIKKWHYFTYNTRIAGVTTMRGVFNWTTSFVPLDPVNNSFWISGCVPGTGNGNDSVGYGLRFSKSGGSDYDFMNQGVMYHDTTNANELCMQNYFFNIAAGVLPAGTYTIEHRLEANDCQLKTYFANSSDAPRIDPQQQGELMIREYKNP